MNLQPEARELLALISQAWLSVKPAARSDFNNLRYLALSVLDAGGQTGSVGEIQEQLGILPACMSRVLKWLSVRELISREFDPADLRRTRVTLTEAGHKALESFHRARVDALAGRLGRLDESSRRGLLCGLTKLHALSAATGEATRPG